ESGKSTRAHPPEWRYNPPRVAAQSPLRPVTWRLRVSAEGPASARRQRSTNPPLDVPASGTPPHHPSAVTHGSRSGRGRAVPPSTRTTPALAVATHQPFPSGSTSVTTWPDRPGRRYTFSPEVTSMKPP